jgi:hypothetical protein
MGSTTYGEEKDLKRQSQKHLSHNTSIENYEK